MQQINTEQSMTLEIRNNESYKKLTRNNWSLSASTMILLKQINTKQSMTGNSEKSNHAKN